MHTSVPEDRAMARAIRAEFAKRRSSSDWVDHFRGVAASGLAGRFLEEAEAQRYFARQHLLAHGFAPRDFDEILLADGRMAFQQRPILRRL